MNIQMVFDLWDTNLFWRFLLLDAGIVLICFLILIIFMIPYLKVREDIYKQYNTLKSKKILISFRKRKQKELYFEARYRVSNRNKNYILYLVASTANMIMGICLGLAFWLTVGGLVTNYVLNNNDSFEPREINEKYSNDTYIDEEYKNEYDEIEVLGDDDTNSHHVDPHWVDSYERSDGTEVNGYWRGGNDGYNRSDPGSDNNGGFVDSILGK